MHVIPCCLALQNTQTSPLLFPPQPPPPPPPGPGLAPPSARLPPFLLASRDENAPSSRPWPDPAEPLDAQVRTRSERKRGRGEARGGGGLLYVRSWEPASRRRRLRTRSAREPAPMASAQEKATDCCRPARDAPGARRVIAAPGKVSMAPRGERVAAAAGGGAVMEEIATAVQPTTAKASSKGIRRLRDRHLPLPLSLSPSSWIMGLFAT